MEQDKLSVLLARYLSGEATAAELQELQNITNEDDALKILLDTLKSFWQINQDEDMEALKATWQNHLRKLK